MRKRLAALGLAGVLSLTLVACDVDPVDPIDPGLNGDELPADTLAPPPDETVAP